MDALLGNYAFASDLFGTSTVVDNKTTNDFDKLLTDYNPFQTLYDNLYESITELSLLPTDTNEIYGVLKLIVSFNGYMESTIKSKEKCTSVACSSPNGYGKNETCILISIPNKSKDYNHYTISNIKFQSIWSSNSDLIANVSLFNDELHIDDMECVYKSDKILTTPETDEYCLDNINVTVKCGQIYVFWLNVLKGSFNFGFSEYDVDGLREKYPLLTNMYMYQWRDKKNFKYDITRNVKKAKLFEIEFC